MKTFKPSEKWAHIGESTWNDDYTKTEEERVETSVTQIPRRNLELKL